MYPDKRGGAAEPKTVYLLFPSHYSFVKKFTKGEGAHIFRLFKHTYTYFMVIPLEQKFIKHRLMYCEMMGVKLLSAVDSEIL